MSEQFHLIASARARVPGTGPTRRRRNTKHGIYKLVWERESRRVLGLHLVTRNASDVVQGLALVLRMGATVDDLAPMHHALPTWCEGAKAAAEQALGSPGKGGYDRRFAPTPAIRR